MRGLNDKKCISCDFWVDIVKKPKSLLAIYLNPALHPVFESPCHWSPDFIDPAFQSTTNLSQNICEL